MDIQDLDAPRPRVVFAARPTRPTLSLLVPIHNEEQVLPCFYERVVCVLDRLELDAEILFVDDGSTDASLRIVEDLRDGDERVALLSLTRNFGKEAAMTAGLDHAEGDAVVIIDADLQDPPELLPRMIEAWNQGYDVVTMRRARRLGEPLPKRAGAWLFYRLLRSISEIEIPNDVGDFRLLSRQAVLALRALPERHRYMKGLYAWIGMPRIELEFDRPPRQAGYSQWSLGRLFGLAMDGITGFSISPLRIAGYGGFMIAGLSLTMALVFVVKTLLLGDPVQGFPTLIITILFLGGVQLIGIGILGEYIGRIYGEVKRRPVYLSQSYRPARVLREATPAEATRTIR